MSTYNKISKQPSTTFVTNNTPTTGNEYVVFSGTGNLDPVSHGTHSIIDIDQRLSDIEKRLAILTPDAELMDKYPSLKEAYDHYKTIEALVSDKRT